MKRVFAFIGGRPEAGQSTIAAELAFEWVKRGASACILTTRRQIDTMGFDCFELPSLAPAAGGGREMGALSTDLAQLEDYDYLALDLPPASIDLALAAGLSGADLVIPMCIEQGTLAEVGGMFREIARRPPPRPLHLVLNQVRDAKAATEAAQRLMASIERKLELPARLAAVLPWEPDLDALDPSALLSMSLPTADLVRAIPPLADSLEGAGGTGQNSMPAAAFWERFQTFVQESSREPASSRGPDSPGEPAPSGEPGEPIALSEPVAAPSPPQKPRPSSAMQPAAAPNPELTAHLDRIAASLESLSKEVARLRSGLAGKFEFEDDGEGEGRKEGAGEPISLDFDGFRRGRGAGKKGA